MNLFFKPRLDRIALLLACGTLLSFLVFYIPNYVMESEPMALTYFRLFFGEAVDFITLALSVTFIYQSYIAGKERLGLLLSSLALAAVKCVYNLPYYYLLETAIGYDWIESTRSSLLINLLVVAIDLAKILLLSLLAVKLSGVFSGAKDKAAHISAIKSGSGDGVMMLAHPEQKAFFSVSLAILIYKLIFEIVDVISHLAEYGSFRTSELIFIVSKLAFFVLLMLVSYILQTLIYNYYRKVTTDANQD